MPAAFDHRQRRRAPLPFQRRGAGDGGRYASGPGVRSQRSGQASVVLALEAVAAQSAAIVRRQGHWLLLLLTVGCASGPEEVPFRGDFQPETIAVLPIAAPDLPQTLRDALDRRAQDFVHGRGYDIVTIDVTVTMLNALGASPTGKLDSDVFRRLRSEFQIDTTLVRTGRAIRGYGDPMTAFVVTWSLIDNASGATMWTAEQGGGTQRASRAAVKGESPYSDDPLMSDEPMVQRSTQTFVTEIEPMTVDQVADAVQGAIAGRIPRRT